MVKSKDPRYPYTHACDYIRVLAGYNENGTKISRADASQIRSGIAKVIGMDDKELACLLADAELKKNNSDRNEESVKIMSAINAVKSKVVEEIICDQCPDQDTEDCLECRR